MTGAGPGAAESGPGGGAADPLLTAAELAAIHRHAVADYPAECCGVLLVRGGARPERRLMPCRNIQDELHAREPARFPRTARTAYYIAPEDLLEIGRREGDGFEVRVIYHSHVDAGAYFSETDRRNAMVDGVPAYADTTYVVVSVAAGRIADTRAHRWDPGAATFVEVPLALAEAPAGRESR
ncbi:MAG TPA: M67 family metallopeptidase [Methylomirabilota bacterium]|nr:M67 family metallopeptidase [Methylomirabilota bacterium]